MADHVLTIDLGTSGPKVAYFTLDGNYVAGEFEPVELVLTDDGGVEQRPGDWWNGIVAGARRLADARVVEPESVVAVAVTSQWSGTVPVDRAHEPLMNAVIWMDARGAEVTERIVGGPVRVSGYDPRKLRSWIRHTGGAPAHSGKDPISHIAWILAARPDVAAATAHYLEPKDWINARLTGRAVATYDSIVVHWLTDNRDLTNIGYVPELLRWSGIPRSVLPDLIAATDVVGPLLPPVADALGVPAGIPVIGGTPDVQSAAIGSGAVRDFAGHLYFGTSSWISCHVPFKKTDIRSGVASLPSPLPGSYFVANEQETAGACLNFLRDQVFFPQDTLDATPPPADVYARFDALAETAPVGSRGVIFTPWLVGERTPVDDHAIRAGWHHVGLGAGRAELVRSVLEGVALNARWLLGAVEKFVDRPFPYLHFIGGGAASPTWAQIVTDVLDREIRVTEHPIRANARGVALLTGLALGRITRDDIERSVPIAATYHPRSEHRDTYDAHYAAFVELYRRNRKIHRGLARG
jgi:xylulokinase